MSQASQSTTPGIILRSTDMLDKKARNSKKIETYHTCRMVSKVFIRGLLLQNFILILFLGFSSSLVYFNLYASFIFNCHLGVFYFARNGPLKL